MNPNHYQFRPMSLLKFLFVGIITTAFVIGAGLDLMNRKRAIQAKFTAPAPAVMLDSVSSPALFPARTPPDVSKRFIAR